MKTIIDKITNLVFEAIKIDRETERKRVKTIVEELINPYPLDLLGSPIPKGNEGKFWKFGNRVWENFREDILKELGYSK